MIAYRAMLILNSLFYLLNNIKKQVKRKDRESKRAKSINGKLEEARLD